MTRWLEKIELFFEVSFRPEDYNVKFTSCTLENASLSWWNSYTKTMAINVANVMYWDELQQLMITEYCPHDEMQKPDQELWNLMIHEVDIATYTSRFNNLATLCPRMVTLEENKIDRYIQGSPQPIQGLVTISKPTTFDRAKRLAFILTHPEVHRGTMVQKVGLPKPKGRKRKF